MKELQIEDIKKYSYEVLCKVADVCEANGLSYSLTGGTLIGAIRHKGFIPWDDDIDIMMPRTDYDRLIDIVSKGDYGFNLFAMENCGGDYWYPFAKACHRDTVLKEEAITPSGIQLGVYVDIFPVDGMGKSYRQAKIRCMVFQFLHGLKITSRWNGYQKSKLRKWYYEPFRYICYLISKMIPKSLIDRIVDGYIRKIPFETSVYAGRMVGDFGSREIMKKSLFDKSIKVKFEGREFCAVKDYDMFLKTLYGDYMQLPPVAKRVTHHKFIAYKMENI